MPPLAAAAALAVGLGVLKRVVAACILPVQPDLVDQRAECGVGRGEPAAPGGGGDRMFGLRIPQVAVGGRKSGSWPIPGRPAGYMSGQRAPHGRALVHRSGVRGVSLARRPGFGTLAR